MNIEQFIETTLKEIINGLDAGSPKKDKGEYFHLDCTGVNFDLAVLVSSENKKESNNTAGANIKVASLNNDSAKSKTEKSECISRVKFTAKLSGNNKGKVINRHNGTLDRI